MGHGVDSLMVAKTMISSVFDFHVAGNESALNAVERGISLDLLTNTSLFVWTEAKTFIILGAAIRYKPNGTIPLCPQCNETATFFKTKNPSIVIFRCKNPTDHARERSFEVPLLQEDDKRRVVSKGCRYIVTQIK